MTVWKILSFLILLTPVVTFVLGPDLLALSAQRSHMAFGLPVPPARASEASWQFAQNMAGQIWFCLGLVLTIASSVVCICIRSQDVEPMCQTALIFLIVQVFLVFLSIIPTEVQLNPAV